MATKSAAVARMRVGTSLKAKDVMQQPVIAATPQASLRDIATQLVTNEFSGMPVAAPDGRVVGVIFRRRRRGRVAQIGCQRSLKKVG